MAKITIRQATREDVDLILQFIKDLATFEHLDHEVSATKELLEEWIFDKEKAQVIFACNEDGLEVGFALYFYNFSTFLGKAGIYLEDLYVKPEYRKMGFGKALLGYLAKLTYDNDCGRMEWACLKWNQNAINFYNAWGATTLDDWVTFRLCGQTLEKMAK